MVEFTILGWFESDVEGRWMTTHEFMERAGDDRMVRLSIPVEAPGASYHVVVVVEPADPTKPASTDFLTDEFVNETAGQWVGEFPTDSEGEYEQRESL